MLKSKLMEVFVALTPPMRRDLRQWVRSPFFNLRKDVIDLYVYLDTSPSSKLKLFAKEMAYKAIYPDDKKFDDAKIRYTMSFLLKTIEQYLSFQHSISDPIIEEWYLAIAYRGLGLEKQFENSIEKLQKQLNEKPNDVQRMRRMFDVERMINSFLSERKRANEQNLEVLSIRLDQFYAAEKLYIVCGLLSHQQMFRNTYDAQGMEALVAQVEYNNWHEEVPGIGVYYYAYQLYTNPEPIPFYEKFKAKLPEYIKIIENIEIRSAYLSAINFAIRQVNKGDKAYFKELFDLYKTGIESKVLLENNELSPFTYKNVVAIGLKLQEMDYIADFIDRYHDALPFEHRKNFYEYCKARLYFTQGNYEKAMPILGQMNYGDIYLQLDANVMICKMYFELRETEVLTSFLHTFKQFIHRRKEAIGYHYQNYYNIIRFVARLSNAAFADAKSQQRLLREIEECTPLTEKEWLLTQLASVK
jgi:hypothetical protein